MKTLTSLFSLMLITNASALMAGTVVPNANVSTAGNTDNRFPFLVSGGMQYQQLFDASQFSGPITIGEIDLRNGVFVNEAFTSTISNIQIFLSTTSATVSTLSNTFASNVGADNTLVYSGSLTLSSANTAGPGNTQVFDISIQFQTPFTYDPSLGNLLLDVDNLSGANSAVGADFFDAVSGSSSLSRVYGAEGSPNATTGTVDTGSGLIAQFDGAASTVPEPASFAFAGLGLAGLLAWRRKRSIHG